MIFICDIKAQNSHRAKLALGGGEGLGVGVTWYSHNRTIVRICALHKQRKYVQIIYSEQKHGDSYIPMFGMGPEKYARRQEVYQRSV